MGEREKIYLENQRGPRLLSCDHGVDPVFYRAFMKNQRLKEKDKEYKSKREQGLHGKNMEQVEEWFRSEGELPSPSSSESEATPVKQSHSVETPVVPVEEAAGKEVIKRKRRLFTSVEEMDSDPLPLEF